MKLIWLLYAVIGLGVYLVIVNRGGVPDGGAKPTPMPEPSAGDIMSGRLYDRSHTGRPAIKGG